MVRKCVGVMDGPEIKGGGFVFGFHRLVESHPPCKAL